MGCAGVLRDGREARGGDEVDGFLDRRWESERWNANELDREGEPLTVPDSVPATAL